MKCIKCNSNKLCGYNPNDINSMIYKDSNSWFFQNPDQKFIYYHSKREYYFNCFDCHSNFYSFLPEDIEINSAKLDHKEIVLDLDKTLFYTDVDVNWMNPDFAFISPCNTKIFVKKRPHLDEFIQFCLSHFNKINIFTAAEDWYANELIQQLKIPKKKLGFIKTHKDTIRKRPITFDWEYIKQMNNSLMIDDKPQVVEGFGNTVFSIKPFYYFNTNDEDDKELLRITKVIKDNSKNITKRNDVFDLKINLFFRKIQINCSNVTRQELNTIYNEIKQITQEEMENGKVFTNLKNFPFTEEDSESRLTFADLNYENYKKLINIIKNKTNYKELNKQEYNAIIL